MELTFLNKPSRDAIFVYPVVKNARGRDKKINKLLEKLAAGGSFDAECDETFFLFNETEALPARTLLLGIGEPEELDVNCVMSAFGTAAKAISSHRAEKVALDLSAEVLIPYIQAIAEAFILGAYQPAAPYKTGEALKKLTKKLTGEIEVIGIEKYQDLVRNFKKGFEIAHSVNSSRDWVNAPPNYANAEFFDELAKKIAKESGSTLKIFYKKEITKMGMGALLAVNRGSPDDPRLVILDYNPKGADKKEPPVVIVGKGLIFDSGGYNLKPRGHIEDMQLDKAGACAVLSVMSLLPKLGINKHIIGIMPFTENLIGENTYKPSEIIKTYSGKTIEITNTDGEGRLILADAISYAVQKYAPEYLIDVATLTGACMIALGDRYAGLFSNDRALSDKLQEAGDEVDELLWPLPIHKEHSEKMKGYYADLRNSDTGFERQAGASKGAAFIKEFIGKDTKWAHLDIAGPAFTTDPKKYEQKGATGFGVRALLRFLEKGL